MELPDCGMIARVLRWAVVGLVLVACGDGASQTSSDAAVAADAADRGDGGPGGGPVLDAAVVCQSAFAMTDQFDGAIDTERWRVVRMPDASDCTVEVDGGVLTFTSADGGSCSIATTGCHDLTDRGIRVMGAMPGDGQPSLRFRLTMKGGTAAEFLAIDRGDGMILELATEIDGERMVLAAPTYDSFAHAQWRFMHTVVADRVDLQTSPPEKDELWETRAEVATSAESIAESIVELGTAAPVGAPEDQVSFDAITGLEP
jgi:hypothetical protein